MTWKVLEFYFDIFLELAFDWNILEKDFICLTQAIKFSEFTFEEMCVECK